MKTTIPATAALVVGAIITVTTAGYIGQSREAEYYKDYQEEIRVIQSYERGYEAGKVAGAKELIYNATKALCPEYTTKCGFDPALHQPFRKPRV